MSSSTRIEKIQLYQFKDFDMETFKSQYLDEVRPHDEVVIPSVYGPAFDETEKKGVKRAAKRDYLIEDKCRYMQDVVIRRGHAKKDDRSFSMSSKILKAVIGPEYKAILTILRRMGYIELGDGKHGQGKYWYYSAYDYSMLYSLCDKEVELSSPSLNARVQGYKQKTIEQIKKMTDEYASGYVEDKFISQYIASLKYVRIEDYDGLREYINQSIQDNPKASMYYDFVFSELEAKERAIYRIDASHRFYHLLTNLDKNIKHYLTIDFMLDCKNSHPLLFNFFICDNYLISKESFYAISSYLVGISNEEIESLSFPFSSSGKIYHNVGEYLYNKLINNDIEVSDVAKLSHDEVEYIYKTSKGLLWDEVCALHPEMDRGEVKAAMFGAVFYSKSPVSDRWNDYAKEFKKTYPSVFALISNWKKDKNQDKVQEYMEAHRLPYKDNRTALSIAMMALESDIFTGVLRRLYAKRWHAVHIHDCIVIPKDGNKTHPTIEQVKEVMADVYKSFGLCPTLDRS